MQERGCQDGLPELQQHRTARSNSRQGVDCGCRTRDRNPVDLVILERMKMKADRSRKTSKHSVRLGRKKAMTDKEDELIARGRVEFDQQEEWEDAIEMEMEMESVRTPVRTCEP